MALNVDPELNIIAVPKKSIPPEATVSDADGPSKMLFIEAVLEIIGAKGVPELITALVLGTPPHQLAPSFQFELVAPNHKPAGLTFINAMLDGASGQTPFETTALK